MNPDLDREAQEALQHPALELTALRKDSGIRYFMAAGISRRSAAAWLTQRDRSTGKKNSSTSVCKTSDAWQFLDGDTLERCACFDDFLSF